ncbi:hypothetical protein [Bradyrhizobium sp. HKCCYLR1051]|uniref:hypothetical protein n=1 Tax=Bradyrhizobium sp. HKCCYLR1051 TaxID=3420738 RepID=UPI003EB747E2
MTTRRNFLGLLAAAPLLPAATKAAGMLTQSPHLRGYAISGAELRVVGELTTEGFVTANQFRRMQDEFAAIGATGEPVDLVLDGRLSHFRPLDVQVIPSPVVMVDHRRKPGVGDHTPELLAAWEIA